MYYILKAWRLIKHSVNFPGKNRSLCKGKNQTKVIALLKKDVGLKLTNNSQNHWGECFLERFSLDVCGND